MTPLDPRTATTVRRLAVAGAVGVALYVGAWLVAGALRDGYDPLRQAISELFEIGAPEPGAGLLRGALVVTGAALVGFAYALHRGLPGRGAAAPVACAVSGVMTVAVVAFPCRAGCPGFGTSFTDTMHVATAATGYVGLILTPLLAGWRVREHDLAFARLSLFLGGLALVGFVVRNAGVDALGGLQQRTFNTVADLWYVLAAAWLVRRTRAGSHGPATT